MTRHVRRGAEDYGRVFAVMYDISGDSSPLFDTITRDWRHLVDDLGITQSDRYLKHRGKPLVVIWGFGFPDRPGSVEDANRIIDFFRAEGISLMAGVPADWRRGGEGVKPGFLPVFERFEVISPWSVGAYHNDADIDFHVSARLSGDLSHTRQRGIDYMPVVFPGFSWSNLFRGSQFNMIPRRGGRHLWKQLYEFQKAGCTMFYGAMFDEVDEGTALFKVVARSSDLPAQGRFVALDADGQQLPSDWYLRLIGEGRRMLRREISLTPNIPISPSQPEPPPPAPGAQQAAFVNQEVPSQVDPGKAFVARVTMRNSGGVAWTAAEGYRLGSQEPQDNQSWGLGRAELPGSVAAGQNATFVLSLVAPSAPGRYAFAWRMLQEQVAWFGQSTPTVWVDDGAPNAPATGTPQEIKVKHGYRGILGREADAGGLQNYSSQLASGSLTVGDFCKALWTSGEFALNRSQLTPEQLAAELYTGILGRAADPGGFTATVDAIRDGRGAERAAEMIESPEFAGRFLQ
ncbi:MAG: DUF4214 domain-containing protein [Myxococcales bacterium]|nr:DUF4214 domain-containing protein [Myxococcales bacterium]